MSIPLLLPTLAARFAWVVANMRYERATGTASDRRIIPLLGPILNHLNRVLRQFAALCARAEAGTLRALPRRRAGKPSAPRFTWPRPPPTLPHGNRWIAKLAPWMGWGGEQVYNLVLHDAEMAALIEAAPQVKRLLRSMLWATFVKPKAMPAILRPPPKARAPRRRPPRATVPPAKPGSTRPVSPRWPYRPSCDWPKGVLDKPPRRRRAKARYVTGPPLPD